MRIAAVLGLVAGLLTVTPSFAQIAGSGGVCGPDGPEGYKRPGGYCEQLGNNSSLAGPGTAPYGGPSESVPEGLEGGGPECEVGPCAA